MKSLITSNAGTLGPYATIGAYASGWLCDGVDFQMTVVGPSIIGEWVEPAPPEPTPEELAAARAAYIATTRATYTAALDALYLAKARERDYDSPYTCTSRAGYPGPWRDEGTAFGVWMDTCNLQGYALMAAVIAGTEQLPSIEDFIASLPALVWPTDDKAPDA